MSTLSIDSVVNQENHYRSTFFFDVQDQEILIEKFRQISNQDNNNLSYYSLALTDGVCELEKSLNDLYINGGEITVVYGSCTLNIYIDREKRLIVFQNINHCENTVQLLEKLQKPYFLKKYIHCYLCESGPYIFMEGIGETAHNYQRHNLYKILNRNDVDFDLLKEIQTIFTDISSHKYYTPDEIRSFLDQEEIRKKYALHPNKKNLSEPSDDGIIAYRKNRDKIFREYIKCNKIHGMRELARIGFIAIHEEGDTGFIATKFVQYGKSTTSFLGTDKQITCNLETATSELLHNFVDLIKGE